ncbi:MAG: hemolysin family protein [archaeon]|nr:hemolysin family protein [archaeon]
MILLLAMSSFFSASETAYSSMNRARLKALDPEGENRKVQRALVNSEDFDKFITTILVGNNIVNIASSTLCTSIMTSMFGPERGVIYATVLMITVLLLVGEITPKTLAKKNPEKMSATLSGGVRAAMVVLSPISWVFLKITKGVNKVAGAEDNATPSITEEELSVMIDEIQEEGALEASESKLIKSAMEFDDIRVVDICVPRVDVVAVPVDASPNAVRSVFEESRFSRLPVYEGNIDHIIGCIYFKDMFLGPEGPDGFDIRTNLRPVKYAPEDTAAATAFRDMQKSKDQITVVIDDFGGTVGIVTMEDLLEEIVGDIWDESDTIKVPVVKESDGTYTVLGDANIYEVMEGIGEKFDPEEYDSVTVGGYLYYRLQKIPQVEDQVRCGDVRMVVKTVRNRRIIKASFIIDPAEDRKEEENQ